MSAQGGTHILTTPAQPLPVLKTLLEAEEEFLLAYGWVKLNEKGRVVWRPPKGRGWGRRYTQRHAVNSQKWFMNEHRTPYWRAGT